MTKNLKKWNSFYWCDTGSLLQHCWEIENFHGTWCPFGETCSSAGKHLGVSTNASSSECWVDWQQCGLGRLPGPQHCLQEAFSVLGTVVLHKQLLGLKG